ncbi:MAG: hypothetical protein HN764_02870 [Gammaproteobacteria bacterium]|nr:hypothetical protein [Gammaproteobacteria bacterium]
MKESNDVLFRALDVVQVKGKRNKTKIFEPVCRKNEADETLLNKINTHEKAMEYYFAEDWQPAMLAFEKLKKEFAEDKLYPVLLDKIAIKNKSE